uniref:Nonstructural protein n=2 Tax=unclassified Microvirus TaxID=338099 RepID=A0AAU8AX40_9VIRU
MKLKIYAIRDLKTCFMTPVVEMNDPSAVRNFEHAVLEGNSLMHSHPGDYALYALGTYDNETGNLECWPAPVQVADASSILLGSRGADIV